MEEFEKLEVELRALYDDYLQKFRYLAYLEHLYEDASKAEQERFERRYFHYINIQIGKKVKLKLYIK